MLQVIYRMANILCSSLDVPTIWGNSSLKTLWNGKGSKSHPSKHRGLRIGSIVCKLIINIILERIRPWYETKLLKKQNGFRRNRSTADRIYSMKRIHQISNSIKATFIYLICRPSIIIRPFIEEMAVQID